MSTDTTSNFVLKKKRRMSKTEAGQPQVKDSAEIDKGEVSAQSASGLQDKGDLGVRDQESTNSVPNNSELREPYKSMMAEVENARKTCSDMAVQRVNVLFPKWKEVAVLVKRAQDLDDKRLNLMKECLRSQSNQSKRLKLDDRAVKQEIEPNQPDMKHTVPLPKDHPTSAQSNSALKTEYSAELDRGDMIQQNVFPAAVKLESELQEKGDLPVPDEESTNFVPDNSEVMIRNILQSVEEMEKDTKTSYITVQQVNFLVAKSEELIAIVKRELNLQDEGLKLMERQLNLMK